MDVGPDDRPWHIDHKKPIARGGADTEENLVLACKRCNLVKNVRSYKEFRALARAAYWVPDEDWRASESDLDRLMDLYDRTIDTVAVDNRWVVDRCEYGVFYIGADGDRRLVLELNEEQKRNEWQRPDAVAALDLLEEVRALLPTLVAEIRMFRSGDLTPGSLTSAELPYAQ